LHAHPRASLLWPGPDLSLAANVAIQQSILEQGGIAPLLALLNGVSDKAQVSADEALSYDDL